MSDQPGGLGRAFGGLHADIKEELGEPRNEVRTELTALRQESRTDCASMRAEVAYLHGRFDVLIWAVGVNAAASIALLGVLLRH
jgi:hypothetical protein